MEIRLTNKNDLDEVMEIYRSWREDIEQLLEEGCEGTWDAGERAAQNDFIETCGYNGVNLEDLNYDDIFDLMLELEEQY